MPGGFSLQKQIQRSILLFNLHKIGTRVLSNLTFFSNFKKIGKNLKKPIDKRPKAWYNEFINLAG